MYSKDDLLCFNIIESVNKIIEISNRFATLEDFKKDFVPYDAVMMNFIIIGEMVVKLSEDFKDKNSQIDWYKIQGFRNIVVHDYFGIDDKVVWQLIHTKLPELKEFLIKYLHL
jgi:uncharacterized protein with HEPN domain